ncbi:MAG TPA: SRPBCC family protein [Phototrophicaceae bacterium]|jgi:hypothetical protein|nr:SRPBCC family protein [Phototrophicaceae bacterium]
MYEYEYALDTDASPEAIYRLYEDVPGWITWDEGIESIEFTEPFIAGSKGKLKVPGQPQLDFTITEVHPGRGFADETPLPAAGITVIFNHILTPLANGRTRIVHQVKIVGPAAETLGPQIGPGITSDLPEAVEKLAHLALIASA